MYGYKLGKELVVLVTDEDVRLIGLLQQDGYDLWNELVRQAGALEEEVAAQIRETERN